DVDAGRAIRRTRSARDERDAGTAGELAMCFRHHHRAALLAADRDGDIAIMERVECGEITFARHAEDMTDAVDQQLVDQHLAAAAHVVFATHEDHPAVFVAAASLRSVGTLASGMAAVNATAAMKNAHRRVGVSSNGKPKRAPAYAVL